MRPIRTAINFLFLIAFGARVAAAFLLKNPWPAGGDASAYVQMGEWLMRHGSVPVLDHPPVYSVFLFFTYTLPHHSVAFALAMQSLVGALCAVMTYGLCASWTTEKTALGAAAIVAVDPFLIYFSTLFLSETLFTFLMLAGFCGLIDLERSPAPARAFLSGALFSVAALCRSILTPLLPLLALSLFFLTKTAAPRRRRLFLAFVCGVALPLTAWSFFLHQKTGQWVLVSAQKGWNSYEGLNPNFDNEGALQQWRDGMRAEVKRLDLHGPVEIDQYYWNKTLHIIRTQPGRTLLQMSRKIFKFWRFVPYFSYSGKERIISAIFMSFLVPFSLFGAWAAWKNERGFTWPAGLLISFVALYTLVNTITWTQIRYRVPIHPIVAIFCALGLVRALSLLQDHTP